MRGTNRDNLGMRHRTEKLRFTRLSGQSIFVAAMFESSLLNLLVIGGAWGVVGSLVGLVTALFSRDKRLTVGTAAGVGFLVGASLGALFGIFYAMLERAA